MERMEKVICTVLTSRASPTAGEEQGAGNNGEKVGFFVGIYFDLGEM